MAADATGTKSVTNTLSGTTADTVTLQQWWDDVEVENHDVVNELWARTDGTAAAADANENTRIGPGQSKKLGISVGPAQGDTPAKPISVVGNAGQYTIEGLTAIASRG